METVRKGLRNGDLDQDTYGRLECTECGAQLDTRDDPDGIGSIRRCPDCGQEWRHL